MRKYLTELFRDASEKLEYLKDIELIFDIPKSEDHGDLSTNAAMLLTRKLRKNPRAIAEEILSELKPDDNVIEKMEIAGPGFINFFFKPEFFAGVIKDIKSKGDEFGRSDVNDGKTANVEFVSANPTGPLTVGHGRNAVIGDTVANLLEATGYKVDREYYFNNAGRQMRMLGASVKLRYLNLCGENIPFPEDHYRGEYIIDIAKKLYDKHDDKLKDEPEEGIFKDAAESEIFENIKESLKQIKIEHDKFYNERSLYDEGRIDKVVDEFKSRDLCYKKEGALWFKLSELGQDQDKVIIKTSGEPTYRLPDIAYHVTKYERGYDTIVDVFGSDHAATYPDVVAALKALGYDEEKINVLIHQFVTFIKDGKKIKMSTRKADYVTIDELAEEVGVDVVRYFFNMRSISTHMNFDIGLAKKQSDENPVFYLQYAHARICSILRMAAKEELEPGYDNAELLREDEEVRLLKLMQEFEGVIRQCAVNYEPNRLAAYLEELAAAFHKFYTVCRIIGSENELAEARLALALSVKTVLQNGLRILGVSAPEKM